MPSDRLTRRSLLFPEDGADILLQLPEGGGLQGLKVDLDLIRCVVLECGLPHLDDVYHTSKLLTCRKRLYTLPASMDSVLKQGFGND